MGYSGNIRANIDSRARIGAGGDINVRQNKINFFASANYNQRKSISDGLTTRRTLGDSTYYSLQDDHSVVRGQFGFGRAGVDYFISNRNTLSIAANFARGSFNPNTNSDIWVDTLSQGSNTSFYNRAADVSGNFRNLGSTISLAFAVAG